MSRINVKGDYC